MFTRTLTFESIAEVLSYIIFFIFSRNFVVSCFFFNNLNSLTTTYGIINTWKNEYTSSKPFFHCCMFCGDILGSYLHANTSMLCHIPHVQLQRATAIELQLILILSQLVFWFSGNVITKAHWRKLNNSIFTIIIFKINYKSQFSFTCFPWN